MNKDVHTAIGRKRLALTAYFERLNEDTRLDAIMALDNLCEAARDEIEKAFLDGYKQASIRTAD